MSLTAGTRIGTCEIVGPLGAGGMGEVYRARDTKLGRDVAVKILPDAFVADADRLARFEREARTLAALNHPNIAQIYEMEDRALVMELVEGEDLAVILARGRVPSSEALPIAMQVAQALEAAHELGIVHRDLKPANIKVRTDGTVKVLDFGLAKAMDPSGASSASLANSPTITSPATELGMILGTAAYMSPEQARGKAVDRRADVWAFGVVFYEMLTGRRAFDGSEVSDVLASVLKDSIAFDALPDDTPAPIRRLLRRCLTKDRTQRLDSMATARLEIAEALAPDADRADGAATKGEIAQAGSGRRATMAILVASALAMGALAAWALFTRPASPASAAVVRFSIPLQQEPRTGVAVTSAGDAIVFEADRLYVRRISDALPRAVPGTDGARRVFTSRDNKWIGYYAGGKIRKVALSGGDPLDVLEVDNDSPGAAWGIDNTIFYSPGWNSALWSVSGDGGAKPVQVSTVDTAAGELGHWWADPLPDGKAVLFTVWMAATGINDARIGVLDLATHKHRILLPGANAKYLATGHLLFYHAGSFQIVPFDAAGQRVTGEPVKVLPDARPLDPTGSATKSFAVSSAGTLAYLTGVLDREVQLAWVTPGGSVEAIPGPPERWNGIWLSPDGSRIAGARTEGGAQSVWLRNLVRQTSERVDIPGSNFGPTWSPTGDFLLFTSMRKGHFDVFMLRPGEGVVRPVIQEPYDQGDMAITHDGKRVVLFDSASDGSTFISLASLENPASRTRLPISAAGIDVVEISPDDRWIAAAAAVSGRSEIAVTPLAAQGPSVRVSPRGGSRPLWSRKGSKLFYQRDDEVVAVTWSAGGGRFAVDKEETLFRLAGYRIEGVGPDGRFLMSKPTPGQEIGIRVVVNWFGEIQK